MKRTRYRASCLEVRELARDLRRNMTAAERRLWEALRRTQLDGARFRSQHAVGRFVADFYCASARLLIEVDGPVHETQCEYDVSRSQALESMGYRVIRFTNEEVQGNLPEVLERIRRELGSRPAEG